MLIYTSLPGSIAEREHKKWENVPDVPGNPYSPEALQRRLSQGLIRDNDIARLVNAAHSADEDVLAPADQPTPLASPLSKPDMSRYIEILPCLYAY